jgi:hypothetical protein
MEDIQNEKMENKECFIYKKYKYIFICGIFCIYYIFVSDSEGYTLVQAHERWIGLTKSK